MYKRVREFYGMSEFIDVYVFLFLKYEFIR